MVEVAIMIEGQNGLNWPRWKRIVQEVEDLGFVGLYRSDHYTNANPPDKDSLELWVSLTWLASNTKRIQFGPLVSPVSFRQPTMTARMAAAVDDLSDGRLVLGLGAGWQPPRVSALQTRRSQCRANHRGWWFAVHRRERRWPLSAGCVAASWRR